METSLNPCRRDTSDITLLSWLATLGRALAGTGIVAGNPRQVMTGTNLPGYVLRLSIAERRYLLRCVLTGDACLALQFTLQPEAEGPSLLTYTLKLNVPSTARFADLDQALATASGRVPTLVSSIQQSCGCSQPSVH